MKKHNWTHNPKPGDMVLVYWLDAKSSVGWFDTEYPPSDLEDASNRTIGFFWKTVEIDYELTPGQYDSKKAIIVLSSCHHKAFKDYGDPHVIPLDMVWNIKQVGLIEAKGE